MPALESNEPLAIAGVLLTKPLATENLRTIWQGKREDGTRVAVHVLNPGLAGTPDAEQFASMARRLESLTADGPVPGVLRVHMVTQDGMVFISDLWTVGTTADVSTLGWPLERRLELFRGICTALGELHARGIVHGCLRPSNVLFDDALNPVLADVSLVDIALSFEGDPDNTNGYGAYAAPEARYGMAMDARTDVFSAGRLLHFLLSDLTPREELEGLPRLESLAMVAPPGIVRIVRKCVLPEPEGRYASIEELLADVARYRTHATSVGLAHPEVSERERPLVPSMKPLTSTGTGPVSVSKRPGAPRAKPAVNVAVKGPARAQASEPVLTPKVRLIIGAAGLAMTATAVIVAWASGSDSMALRALAAVGVALGALLVPPLAGRAALTGVLVASFAILVVLVLDPVGHASGLGQRSQLASGDVATRARMIRERAPRGEKHFDDMALAGADFSEAVLLNVYLERCDLTGASFRRAMLAGSHFSGAKLAGANVAGADFSDADLTGVDLAEVLEIERAICDPKTRMPSGWHCEKYRMVRGRP